MGSCFSSPKKVDNGRGKGNGKDGGGGGGQWSGRAGKPHELQPYDPVRYLSDQKDIRDPNRLVNRVHFVAQTVLANGGNHWVMYLQTGPAAAIRINMAPCDMLGAQVPGHGYRGEMEIVYLDLGIAGNQEGIVTIPATRGHPVAQYIDAIINSGNHKYDLTTEGRGCTRWILDQFHLFLQLSLIPPGFDIIETAMEMEWFGGRPRRAWPATHGFYMRETRGGGWGGSPAEGEENRATSCRQLEPVLRSS